MLFNKIYFWFWVLGDVDLGTEPENIKFHNTVHAILKFPSNAHYFGSCSILPAHDEKLSNKVLFLQQSEMRYLRKHLLAKLFNLFEFITYTRRQNCFHLRPAYLFLSLDRQYLATHQLSISWVASITLGALAANVSSLGLLITTLQSVLQFYN